MQVTSRFLRPIAKQTKRTNRTNRIALSFLIAIAAAAWQGCVMDAETGSESQSAKTDPEAGAKTLQEKPPAQANGTIPLGCSLQWSSTAHDSVLYCPDLRPPKP